MSVGQQSGVKQRSLLQCHPNRYISYTVWITNESPGLACLPRGPGFTKCKFQEETIQRIYPRRLPAMMHKTLIKLKLHLPSQISVHRKNQPVGKPWTHPYWEEKHFFHRHHWAHSKPLLPDHEPENMAVLTNSSLRRRLVYSLEGGCKVLQFQWKA